MKYPNILYLIDSTKFEIDELNNDRVKKDDIRAAVRVKFEEAAKKLTVGSYTEKAVETSYGFHIIYKSDEQEKIDALASTLTTGRLNGVLDRTWLREMTLQIAIIRSYQSEIAARTKDEEIQEFSARITSNLDNIYNQFHFDIILRSHQLE